MATLTDRLLNRWELHHPAILSTATFAVALWKGPRSYALVDTSKLHIDQLYTCMFTYATVITAFLLTFYTFIITGDRGFLPAARESLYFKRTISYTLRAIIFGALLSVVTVPLLIVQPVPKAGETWMIYAAAWFGLTTWATASFIRSSWLFVVFTRGIK